MNAGSDVEGTKEKEKNVHYTCVVLHVAHAINVFMCCEGKARQRKPRDAAKNRPEGCIWTLASHSTRERNEANTGRGVNPGQRDQDSQLRDSWYICRSKKIFKKPLSPL